jgi:hypothetical protein
MRKPFCNGLLDAGQVHHDSTLGFGAIFAALHSPTPAELVAIEVEPHSLAAERQNAEHAVDARCHDEADLSTVVRFLVQAIGSRTIALQSASPFAMDCNRLLECAPRIEAISRRGDPKPRIHAT